MLSPRALEVEIPISVKTYDIDFAGVVSNIVYIRWLEDLRLKFLDVHFPLDKQMQQVQKAEGRRQKAEGTHA